MIITFSLDIVVVFSRSGARARQGVIRADGHRRLDGLLRLLDAVVENFEERVRLLVRCQTIVERFLWKNLSKYFVFFQSCIFQHTKQILLQGLIKKCLALCVFNVYHRVHNMALPCQSLAVD